MIDCIIDFRWENGNFKGKFQLKFLEIFFGIIIIGEIDNVIIKFYIFVLL